MYKIFLNTRLSRDATDFYLQTIKKAIENKGHNCIFINSLVEINSNDTIIITNVKDFCCVFFKKHNKNIIAWFQGIVPEEILLLWKNSLQKYIRKFYCEIMERITLKYSSKIFFVSESMRIHYKKKYNYNKSNYIIMPCFNSTIQRESFYYKDKYNNPTFVYAGSLVDWQCIDRTLKIYKKIEDLIKGTSLTLITAEKENATKMINKYQIKNYEVKYMKYDEINGELSKYKYGFLIRDNIDVNYVSTPTKMSTYLANGIIPIYSNVIGDFKTNINKLRYRICLDNDSDTESLMMKIDAMQKELISPDDIFNDYNKIFESYYSFDYYINLIGKIL